MTFLSWFTRVFTNTAGYGQDESEMLRQMHASPAGLSHMTVIII
jgi:hypothetical protein